MRKLSIVLMLAGFLVFVTFSTFVSADPINLPVKWSLQPNMDGGTDFLSMHRANGPVVADDFKSDGRLIVGFHWWGSYFSNAPDLSGGLSRQVQFEMSFHPDVPATETQVSQPGQPYQFQIVNAQETFYGTTAAGENVYEYYAMLNSPWQETAGNIYWADIAWFAGQFGTDPAANIWGWHESLLHWNDHAVTTLVPGPGANPHTGTWQPLTGHDMAFEIFTTPEPSTFLLFGSGLAGLGIMRRKFKK